MLVTAIFAWFHIASAIMWLGGGILFAFVIGARARKTISTQHGRIFRKSRAKGFDVFPSCCGRDGFVWSPSDSDWIEQRRLRPILFLKQMGFRNNSWIVYRPRGFSEFGIRRSTTSKESHQDHKGNAIFRSTSTSRRTPKNCKAGTDDRLCNSDTTNHRTCLHGLSRLLLILCLVFPYTASPLHVTSCFSVVGQIRKELDQSQILQRRIRVCNLSLDTTPSDHCSTLSR